MEKSKRRQNFSSDEVEILVRGIEKNTKVRMFQGKLLLFSENVGRSFGNCLCPRKIWIRFCNEAAPCYNIVSVRPSHSCGLIWLVRSSSFSCQ